MKKIFLLLFFRISSSRFSGRDLYRRDDFLLLVLQSTDLTQGIQNGLSLIWISVQKESLVDQSWKATQLFPYLGIERRSFTGTSTEHFGPTVAKIGSLLGNEWSFAAGSRVVLQPKVARCASYQKASTISASWITTSQIASNAFTVGTAAVLPFYTLMVLAPKAELTKRSMESSIPYVVLGLTYAFLLYLSWSPDTLKMMFAGKYLLPELPGIAKMFSSEMTLASAWIHLLAVDLFAARQVFHDGLKNEIETRHSVSLCLLFCPIGIATHVITKALTKRANDIK